MGEEEIYFRRLPWWRMFPGLPRCPCTYLPFRFSSGRDPRGLSYALLEAARAIEPLASALQDDPSAAVREAAAQALKKLQGS